MQELEQKYFRNGVEYKEQIEVYEFKDWLITITGDDELTGFATPTKYAHLLNKDNFDYIDQIAEQNGIKFLLNEDGDFYYEDFDYILLEPDDIFKFGFEEINIKKASCVLDYMVKEILRYITPITVDDRFMMALGIQRFNDTKMVVLKQIQKKSIIPKTSKRKTGFLHQAWASLVKLRDKKCTECKSVYDLHAHHIKSYKDFEELRYDVNNGITLCGQCHRKTHKQNNNEYSRI